MIAMNEHELNQIAFRKLAAFIGQSYPNGRFLAIAGVRIVADGASFGELDVSLHATGHDSPDVLVVQAGVEYPESAAIFVQDE